MSGTVGIVLDSVLPHLKPELLEDVFVRERDGTDRGYFRKTRCCDILN